MDFKEILDQYNELCEDNDWQVYHTPKNLAAAICVNAGKILEHFQWITEEDSLSLGRIPQRKAELAEKVADLFFCLMALSDKTGIDLEQAILSKAKKNKEEHKGAPDEWE